LISRQSFRHSRASQQSMEPEGSWPCSQEFSAESGQSVFHTTQSQLSKIHLNTFPPPLKTYEVIFLSYKFNTALYFIYGLFNEAVRYKFYSAK
jgi:hypothetical protein